MNFKFSPLQHSKLLTLIPTITLLFALFSCSGSTDSPEIIDLESIEQQLMLLDENVQKEIAVRPVDSRGVEKIVPRTIDEDGSLVVVSGKDWTSGFFPGTLWYMYALSGKSVWKEKAIEYTSKLEQEMYNGSNHDVGFRMYCSYGTGLSLSGDESYVPVLIQSAKTLIARYYETVGSIRSWDHNQDKWQCPVIVDNMMNLELLFWASEETGDPIYREIAIQHTETTLKHHYRTDNSSFHVVDYDTITGEVIQKNTHQGYSDESAWSRGQAWGLYGFTTTYRYTKDQRYLEQAEKIAGFLLNHPNLPEDLIPYWDFDAPGIPNEERDASAGAIIASALYELSTFSDQGGFFREKADKMVESLGTIYASLPGENYGFILDHSVGSKPRGPGGEIDVPLDYADYYFLEALLRKSKLDAFAEMPGCYKHVDQVLWVVSDLDNTMAKYRKLGFDQFVDLGQVTVKSESRAYREEVRLVCANLGNANVTWIQTLEGESLFSDFHTKHGDAAMSLVHRLPDVNALEKEVGRLESLGIKVLEEVTIDTGKGKLHFVLMDTQQEGKYILGFTYGESGLEIQAALNGGNRHAMKLNQYAFAIRDPAPVSEFWQKLGLPEMQINHPELGKPMYFGEPADHDLIQG